MKEIESVVRKKSLPKDIEEKLTGVVDEVRKKSISQSLKEMQEEKQEREREEEENKSGIVVYEEDRIPERVKSKSSSITPLTTADVVVRVTEYD